MEINFSRPSNNSGRDNFGGTSSGFVKGFSEQELNNWIAICVIKVFLSFTALFGNAAILLTMWKTSSLHSAANIFLANLALSDLTVGLVVQPLFAASILSGKRNLFVFVLGDILEVLLTFVSFITVTAITVDRLLALQLHLRYHAKVTQFRITWFVICTWVFTGIFVSSRLWNSSLFYTAPPVLFITLLVGNFFVYLKIFLIVRRHQRQIQQQQQQQQKSNIFLGVKRSKKTVLNTFLVYILLLCCYLPYSVLYKMNLTGVSFSPSVYLSAITLIFLNSSLNPLLYCWRDREIRTAVKQLFRRL